MSSHLIQDFVEHCRIDRSLSQNTTRAYRQDLKALATFFGDARGLSGATVADLSSFVKDLKDVQELEPSTIRRRLVTIRAFYQWLVKSGRLPTSPCDDLDIEIRLPKRLPRPVDRPTLSHLFRETRRISPPSADPQRHRHTGRIGSQEVTSLVVRVLVSTGLRIGEATSLRISDLSAGGSSIRVHGKGSRERTVYISNEKLLSDLQQYQADRRLQADPAAHLFANSRGDRLTEVAFRKRLKNLSTELEIYPHLTPHRFRHSAATLLIEEGVDIRLVQRLLGHASIATTEIYTRVSDNSLITAIRDADTLAKVDFR